MSLGKSRRLLAGWYADHLVRARVPGGQNGFEDSGLDCLDSSPASD